MAAERLARILAEFRQLQSNAQPESIRLCELCASVSEMSGAGISLMSEQVMVASLCTTDKVSALVDELQYTFGEGPSIDAFNQDTPVLEPNLVDPVRSRWTAFTPSAVAAGALAVFAFPLHVGAVRLGALGLYRDRAGDLRDGQHADALVLAGVAARAVLAMQAHSLPDTLPAELDHGADLRLVVHQATGMVAAQLGVELGVAFVRLRAHAFSTGRRLSEVAEAVVGGRLRLDDGYD